MTKTSSYRPYKRQFHVSPSVLSCVFWSVSNTKHSSTWANTNTMISFFPSWEHFTSNSGRENTVWNRDTQEPTSYWWKTIYFPHWTKGYLQQSVEESCCVAIKVDAQTGPALGDRKAREECDVGWLTDKRKQQWNTLLRSCTISQPAAPHDCKKKQNKHSKNKYQPVFTQHGLSLERGWVGGGGGGVKTYFTYFSLFFNLKRKTKPPGHQIWS